MKEKENEKNKLLNFQSSHCDSNVENANYYEYKNEIDSTKN